MKIIKNTNHLADSIRIYERYNMMINILTFFVVCITVYYLYFINTSLDTYKHKKFILTFYQNIKLQLSIISLLFVFISGYFGKRLILLSIILLFGYIISMVQIQQKYNILNQLTSNQQTKSKNQTKENMENMGNVDGSNSGFPAEFSYDNLRLEQNNLPSIIPMPYQDHTIAPNTDLPKVDSNCVDMWNKNGIKTYAPGIYSQSDIAYNFNMA